MHARTTHNIHNIALAPENVQEKRPFLIDSEDCHAAKKTTPFFLTAAFR